VTGDPALDLALSLFGVLALVGAAYLLGATRTAAVTLEAAAERLAFDEPDFAVGDWLIDGAGRAAAAMSRDGREIALVFALGDGLATRRLSRGRVVAERAGSDIVIRLGEPSLGKLRLAAPDVATADEWVLRLAGPNSMIRP
jgi:hypothetical protein